MVIIGVDCIKYTVGVELFMDLTVRTTQKWQKMVVNKAIATKRSFLQKSLVGLMVVCNNGQDGSKVSIYAKPDWRGGAPIEVTRHNTSFSDILSILIEKINTERNDINNKKGEILVSYSA